MPKNDLSWDTSLGLGALCLEAGGVDMYPRGPLDSRSLYSPHRLGCCRLSSLPGRLVLPTPRTVQVPGFPRTTASPVLDLLST